MTSYMLGSVTRNAPFSTMDFEVRPLPREEWGTSDFVVGEVLGSSRGYLLEWPDGHLGELVQGDLVVGAFGNRCATLDLVGDWQAIGEDGIMDDLTVAGVLGRVTSRAAVSTTPTPLRYRGHVLIGGVPSLMSDWVRKAQAKTFDIPVIQVIGTSMECGKTTAAKAVIRLLSRRGLRVAGMKLSGVGRYRDILGMRDAGAAMILDFVDAGLPSSIGDPTELAGALHNLLLRAVDESVDVVVVEVGASPMEPYNGEAAMQLVAPNVSFSLLAASDLYAALGAIDHLKFRPDIVVGRVASTSAGVEIVSRVTGLPTIDPLNQASLADLDRLLEGVLP